MDELRRMRRIGECSASVTNFGRILSTDHDSRHGVKRVHKTGRCVPLLRVFVFLSCVTALPPLLDNQESKKRCL